MLDYFIRLINKKFIKTYELNRKKASCCHLKNCCQSNINKILNKQFVLLLSTFTLKNLVSIYNKHIGS